MGSFEVKIQSFQHDLNRAIGSRIGQSRCANHAPIVVSLAFLAFAKFAKRKIPMQYYIIFY